jgi:hypothetical protein
MNNTTNYLRVFFWLFVISEGVRSVIMANVAIFSETCLMSCVMILMYSFFKGATDCLFERPAWSVSYDGNSGKPIREEVYDSKSYLECLKLKEVD